MVTFIRLAALSLLAHIPLVAADAPAQTYVIQTVAGTDSIGDGGPALSALLTQPEGVAVDRAGSVYVTDAIDHRVRKITPDGAIQTVAGAGVAGFAGDGGPANAALLNQPYGVAVDAAGNLYIADLGNARVRRVSIDGTIQTVAGGGKIVAGINDALPAVNAQLLQPRNVAVDSSGSLYISDFGTHRAYQVSPAGILTSFAGTGNAGFSGDNGAALLAHLRAPAGLACDSYGAVYIADSGNNRIRKVENGLISTVAANIVSPTGVAVAASGTLYIAADSYFGTPYRPIAGIPSARDVAVDSTGMAYVTTGQFVRKTSTVAPVTTVAGSGAARYFGGDNGPASAARLHTPSGLAIDNSGNWYIADTANNRVRKITAAGVISTIAGTGDPGAKGDNGPATAAQLNGPRSVAVDSLHNVYIADTGNNAIRKITPGGVISTVLNQLNDPEYLSAGADQSVYIADTGNNRVLKLTAAGVVNTPTQALQPAAVMVDPLGNLFVSGQHNVWELTAMGVMGLVVGDLNAPRGVALTPDGDLLIVETGANVIRSVSPSGVAGTIAGTGAPGFSGDGSAATAAQLNSPLDLAVDANGQVWIADSANNRVRSLTASAIAAAATVPIATVLNAATLAPGPVAPGEIVIIQGGGFQPGQTELFFDGQPATIFHVDPGQILALAPGDLTPSATTEIVLLVNGAKTEDFQASVVDVSPGLFTLLNGTGQAVATNQDGTANSDSNPAPRGSVVSLYATGLGSASALTLTIGGYQADLLYAGPAQDASGMTRIDARVPGGFLAPGIQQVVLSVGTAQSQSGVTIVLQ